MRANTSFTASTSYVRYPDRARARSSVAASATLRTVRLVAEPITAEAFAPYGQLISPTDDMKAFDQEDAQLDLEQGQPRFYIMRLPAKPSGLSFTQITHHKKVTQCLGSVTPEPWYMAVAPAAAERPAAEDVKVFKVPFGQFIKLNAGTWHAGPHFVGHDYMDFANLELIDTNQVDHYNHHFDEAEGSILHIEEC